MSSVNIYAVCLIDCNEWKTEKRHECANMGKVKRLELWWQLYRTSFPVWDLENFRPMDFCSTVYPACIDMTDGEPRCCELVKMNNAAYGIGSSEPGSFAARQLVTSWPPPLTSKVIEFLTVSIIRFSAERGADCKYGMWIKRALHGGQYLTLLQCYELTIGTEQILFKAAALPRFFFRKHL